MLNTEKRILVYGAGPMGHTLARLMSRKSEHVMHCVSDRKLAEKLQKSRQVRIINSTFTIPDNVNIQSTCKPENNDIILIALSSREIEETIEKILNDAAGNSYTFVIFTKGFLGKSLRKKFHVLTFCSYFEKYCETHEIPNMKFAAVNGPSLISEVVYDDYSFFNVGARDSETGHLIADLLASERVQTDWTEDVIGVEIAGAMKNTYAILAGISEGIDGCHSNFQGELIASSFNEMLRFGVTAGGQTETFLGKSGLADLITSTTSPNSRNRDYGYKFIKRIMSGDNDPGFFSRLELFFNPTRYIESEVTQHSEIVEGVFAIASIMEIAGELKIELPLVRTVYEVLSRKRSPLAIISTLTGDRSAENIPLPVAGKKEGLNLASGHSFIDILTDRISNSVTKTRGLQSRIRKQTVVILENLTKRLRKAELRKSKADLKKIPLEIAQWKKLNESNPDQERSILKGLIHFYIDEISDTYRPGFRETLIRIVKPARMLANSLNLSSGTPHIGGRINEVKRLARRYNILYAPTHRSHLDSVEISFGITSLDLPMPRYAADINLMSDPLWSWMLRSFGSYTVDRERTRNILYLECLSAYASLLTEVGIPSLVYLEGTRSRTGGIMPIKTGLLSTAVQAFQNTGREVVIIPVTISYERVVEDSYFSNSTKTPSFNKYVMNKGEVYIDFGEAIQISHHINNDDPMLSIAYNVTNAWKKSFRILPNYILSGILVENNFSIEEENLKLLIEDFIQRHPGNYMTENPDKIIQKGMKILKHRNMIEIEKGQIIGKDQGLLGYYAAMVPDNSSEAI